MTPDTERPEAGALDGKVHIYVGAAHRIMSIAAAESLVTKITDAIELAKKQEADKA
jgi:hypothetical protein